MEISWTFRGVKSLRSCLHAEHHLIALGHVKIPKNRITFQDLKFIEAGQKKCHPEP